MKSRLEHVAVTNEWASGLKKVYRHSIQLSIVGHVAYVVAQDQPTDQSCLIVDLESRCGKQKNRSVQKKSRLETKTILFIKPSYHAKRENSRLVFGIAEHHYSSTSSIKLLFESRAENLGKRAVANVLPGTRSQRGLGLCAVTANGETHLVASPATISSQLDMLGSQRDNQILVDYSKFISLLLGTGLANIIRSNGIDLAREKESTLLHQVKRRIAVLGYSSIEDCLDLVPRDLNEADTLIGILIVSFTAFIRALDVYSDITEKLGYLIMRLIPGQIMCVWTRSCASVEQVYSLGIAISQAMEHLGNHSKHLTVFSLNVINDALNVARHGKYQLAEKVYILNLLVDRSIYKNNSKPQDAKGFGNFIVITREYLGEDPKNMVIEIICCSSRFVSIKTTSQEHIIELSTLLKKPAGQVILSGSVSLMRDQEYKVVEEIQLIYEKTYEQNDQVSELVAHIVGNYSNTCWSVVSPIFSREFVYEQHVRHLEGLMRSPYHCALVLDENLNLIETIEELSPNCQMPNGRMDTSSIAYLSAGLQDRDRALIHQIHAETLQVDKWNMTDKYFDHDEGICFENYQYQIIIQNEMGSTRDIRQLERELYEDQDAPHVSMAYLDLKSDELGGGNDDLHGAAEEPQTQREKLKALMNELQKEIKKLRALNQCFNVRGEE